MINSVLRRCNDNMRSFFGDVIVIDEKGGSYDVPVLYGSAEDAKEWGFAVADQFLHAAIKENENFGTFIKTLRFPVLSIELVNSDFEKNDPVLTYNLHALSAFQEDMNQIVEQVTLKFTDRSHYKLEDLANNEDIKSCKLKQWRFTVTLNLDKNG